ncbi:alanyl-tRNA synthetase [Cladophialophora psammophila CBS 110553]|uniref:Alanyl-tRNA synthetase n=1 Tax=Cladophialophora psammophila CBS 110553 TaxID=1182543 RepID=W9WT98_9EURO|nr:alanyl-tRNA synthetase [Cladophialophora psammophila CBS 110553]EXJ68260.1 alanyl-tRNA synthetase [Cladophialophora psammophila CBS 110553]
MSTSLPRTVLAYQHNAKLYTLSTLITSITPFHQLAEASRQLFKTAPDEGSLVVTTAETIFHPQGGGQPSDTGSITSPSDDGARFDVSAVRMDVVNDGVVLHLGRFADPAKTFVAGAPATQAIDVDKRLLYSRLHTAGHVLGAAVRHLLEHEIAGFDELKASHFPDSAACEFQGLIEGKWKEPIQKRVDDYVARAMPVEIEFWDESDFRREGLERLIPRDDEGVKLPGPGEKFRVVRIVGAEAYPCGGTHVDTTGLCGNVGVKKISRNKGTSRVSYNVSSTL